MTATPTTPAATAHQPRVTATPRSTFLARVRTLPRPAAYPVLLALLAPVSMYNGVASQLAFGSVVRSIVVAGLVGLMVTWLLTVLLRDKDRGAALAAVVIMVIGWGRQPALLALPIIVLVFLGLEAGLRRRGRPPLPWSLVTTLFTLGAFIALGANVISAVQAVAPWSPRPPVETGLPAAYQAPDPATLPDVYLIMLDGHARPDTLDDLGIPTQPLRDGLAANGLTLADRATGSYGFTSLVLSSMFNGDHLDDLEAAGTITRTPEGGIDTWNAIQRGTMLERFRAAGYDITAISPGFDHVELRSADRFIDPGPLGLFEFKLLDKGLVGALAERLDPELPFDALRERIVDQFQVAAALAEEPGERPRLVFTHVPAPHGPLVFRADGTARPSDGMDSYENESPMMARLGRQGWAAEYGGHLQYTDQLALEAVERIVSADPGAVVVLFSDHGHQWIRYPYGSLDDDPLPEFGTMDQRSRVLLAGRTPGVEDVITPDLSLVNLLGRLLRAYAAQPWTDQPDRLFDCTPDAARCEPWPG